MTPSVPPPVPMAVTIGSTACSAALWRRLTDSRLDFAEAVAALEADPAARAELVRVAPELERRCAPCGERAVVTTLAPLISVYGVGDRSAAEWAGFWRFYHRALADLPLAALEAGVAAHVAAADSHFFPKPGPLRALCLRAAELSFRALGRARRALAQTSPKIREAR